MFCSRACRGLAKTAEGIVDVACETCGKVFRRNRARIGEHVYCSQECNWASPSETNKVALRCPQCDREHFRHPSHAHKLHCSLNCARAAKHQTTMERVSEHQKQFHCRQCRRVFFRVREGAGFCSRECSIVSQRGRARIPRTDPQQCAGCLLFKPLTTDFPKIRRSNLYGLRCKACRALQGTSPEGKRRSHLRTHFGISLEDWLIMYDGQNGTCAVCAKDLPPKENLNIQATRATRWKERNWNTDHCHYTGKVRAILCRLCNQVLGALRDNPEIARRAAAYLDSHRVCAHSECAEGPAGFCSHAPTEPKFAGKRRKKATQRRRRRVARQRPTGFVQLTFAA